MPNYDFGLGAGLGGADIAALGNEIAKVVGTNFTEVQNTQVDLAAKPADAGLMAEFMMDMMVFTVAMKVLFAVTATIKDMGDFAAQKL